MTNGKPEAFRTGGGKAAKEQERGARPQKIKLGQPYSNAP